MVAISSATLTTLINGLNDVHLSRYLAGAGLTLVIYDWILLFQLESRTIWLARWTLPKILYYFVRLFTIPFLAIAAYDLMDFRPDLSERFCDIWLTLISAPMLMTFAASNWLFTLRLIAIYQRQKALIWFMRVFYICTYAIAFAMLIMTLVVYAQLGINYNPVAKCCQALQTIPYSGPIFYTPALYELLIFALTAYRAHKDAVITNPSTRPVVILLYRDNVVAFFVMLAMRSWNIWIYANQPVTAHHIGTNLYWATNTILSTRIYLNLVWAVQKPLVSVFADTGNTCSARITAASKISDPSMQMHEMKAYQAELYGQ